MIPNVGITKVDRQTGVVRPSLTGVLAIIAPCEKGSLNTPQGYTDAKLALADLGRGPLTGWAGAVMGITKKPVVLIRSKSSTAGSVGSPTTVGGGTSVVTVANSPTPYDDYDIQVLFLSGGTVGTDKPRYAVSFDGGRNFSGSYALSTSTLTIADAGFSFSFAAGTVLEGQTVSVTTTGPRCSDTDDLADALEALRVSRLNWEAVLLHGEIKESLSTVTVSQVNTWLTDLQTKGRFRTAVLNLRKKGASESEAAYLTAATTATASSTSLDIVVAADAGDVFDRLLNATVTRPAGVFVAARGMAVDAAEDVAYVARGALDGVKISDTRGNPLHHDEALYPGLDDLRLATLRSIEGRQGTYINNAPVLSPDGSDYVYWQHARIANRACEIAYQTLTDMLSKGVDKSPTVGPNGERYIAEEAAKLIEGIVNAALSELRGRTSEIQCVLSRTDDISSNAGATITAKVEIVALAYVKQFAVSVGYVKAVSGGAS